MYNRFLMKIRRHLFGLVFIFFLSTLFLLLVWSLAPTSFHGTTPQRIPHTLEELKVVAEFLKEYRNEHYIYTLFMFSVFYLYKQTFAIPGSFFMNLLAGALFGRWIGGFIVCPLTALGASFCYLLRIFPFTPHWLVNISSPFLGIPLHKFALSVLLGVAPYNFLCVRAGGILADIKTASDVLDWKTLLELFLIALFIFCVGIMAKKREQESSTEDLSETHAHS